jgi:hypothetical protein
MSKYIAPIISKYPHMKVVYLCVKPMDKMEFFSLNFHCIPFDTYKEADDYYDKHYKNSKIEISTLMPVCKYIPSPLHPLVLNYKLAKLFINAQVEPKIQQPF